MLLPSGHKHGPFFYLDRCLAKGRMSSLLLKSDAQITQARQAVQPTAKCSKLWTSSPGSIWSCCGASSPCPGNPPPVSDCVSSEPTFAMSFASTGWPAASATPVVTPSSPPRPSGLACSSAPCSKPPASSNSKARRAAQPGKTRSVTLKPISDDALAYATERMHLEPLRTTLATTNKLLKRNKAFLRNQMSGLLSLNLDANEHFKSRSRCCPQCLQRQITIKNAQGQEEESPSIITKRFMPNSVGRRGIRCWMSNPCVRGRRSGLPRCACWADCGVSMACASSTSWWPMPGSQGAFPQSGDRLGLGRCRGAQARGLRRLPRSLALDPRPTHRRVQTRGARGPPLGSARPDLLQNLWPSGTGGAGRGKMEPVQSRGLQKDTRSQTVQLLMGGDRGTRRLWLPHHLEPGAWSVADREKCLQLPDPTLAPAHCSHHDPTSILVCLLIPLLAFNLFHALFCSMVSSIGRARSPCKNCACNSTGPLNTACSCPCSAGEPKNRL